MAKADERRVCREKGCELEAAPRLTRCIECWYNGKPPFVREEAALRRLALVPEEYRVARVPESKWPPGRRWCAGCQTFVRLEDCRGAKCKACNAVASHRSKTKSTYGIDDSTYQWLVDVQLGRCAICRKRRREKRFAVDHEHGHEECGGRGCRECVRGLCCVRCNHDLLGAAHDSIQILRNAVAYLERPPMSGDWRPPQSELDEWERLHPGEPPAPF